MGDTIKSEGTDRQINATNRGLPRLLRTISDNVAPYEQSLLNARATIDPQNMALDESLAKYFLPRYNQIGTDIQGQNAWNTANNELNVLSGPGTDLVKYSRQLDDIQNPEYNQVRTQAANKLTALLQGQDPNKLTGSELANAERGINRTNVSNGVSDIPTSTGAISNAMTFGGALDKKRNTLLNTINAVPQNLASFKSAADPFQVATGRPSYGTNTGASQYGTSKNGFGTNVAGIGQNLLGEAGQNNRLNNQLDANKRDALDRVNQTMSSLPSD